MTWALLDLTKPGSRLLLNFEEMPAPKWVEFSEVLPCVAKARDVLHHDLKERLINSKIGTLAEKAYCIATVLHPCTNHFNFTSESNVPNGMKEQAIRWAREMYNNEYKPKTVAAAAAPADNATLPSPKRRRVGGLFGLLSMPEAEPASIGPDPPPPPVCEMEEYLGRPQLERQADFDLLAWWQNEEPRFPNLARMARQVHGAPIASAGVERVFSAAGMMHGDKEKQHNPLTLKNQLFASFY